VLNANSQSSDQIIVDNWYSNFKNSKFMQTDGVEMWLDETNANDVYNRYKAVTEITDIAEQIKELTQLLNDIGVTVSEEMLQLLKDSTEQRKNGLYNKYIKGKFGVRWEDIVSLKSNSYFNTIFNTFNTKIKQDEDNEGEEDRLRIFNYNPFEGATGITGYLKETLVQLYRDNAEVLYSDSHRNVAGDKVYAYSQPKMVENIFNRLANQSPNIIKSKFTDNKDTPNALILGIEQGYVKMGMVEGMKKRGDDTGVEASKESEKEMQLDKMSRTLNKGNKTRHIVLPTISDKGRFLQLSIPAIDLTVNDRLYSDTAMSKLYDLARAERTRHIDINTHLQTYGTTGNDSIDKGHSVYTFFPLMNREILLDKIEKGLVTGITVEQAMAQYNPISYLNSEGKEVISYVPTDSILEFIVNTTLSKQVSQRLEEWKRIGIYKPGTKEPSDVYLDSSWVFNSKLKQIVKKFNENGKEFTYIDQANMDAAYTQAALEYEFYNLYANGEYYRVFGGDPIGAFKGKGSLSNITEAIKVEVIKRNAKDIAPGNEGNPMIWEDGKWVEKKTYTTAIINDNKAGTVNEYLKNHPQLAEAYSEIERTDAQEYTTGVEHIDVMFFAGKIKDEDYKRIRTKLLSQDKNGVNDSNILNKEEYGLIMQPLKPVAVDDYPYAGYSWKVYVKSSSIPLIPQYTQGHEIDKLRQMMVKHEVDRLAHATAVKLGRFNVSKVYEDGKINDTVALTPMTLNRSSFRLQQEVPYDATKSQIVFVSQMDKLITEGILSTQGFDFKGNKVSGQDLRIRKEEIRKELFDIAKEQLLNRIGKPREVYDENTGTTKLVFDDLKMLESYIREQSNASTKLNINDTYSIKVVNGKFEIPLFFNNASNKFESLLTSLVSKVVLGKISGKKYVQTSGDSWIASDNFNNLTSGVVYSNSYDPDKGLQTLRIVDKVTKLPVEGITSDTFLNASNEERSALFEKYKVLPAQLIVPFKFRDDNGNLLKLSDFTDANGNIDNSKLPESLLRLVGARIPNQSFGSMLPIEIVGFLPKSMGDTMVVPVEWTKQSGSDKVIVRVKFL